MDTSPPTLPKKGLGPLAWIGIGCGGIVVLIVIGIAVAGMLWGGKVKEFVAEMEKNPTRTTATTMVAVSAGQFEMVAEDDVNKRYTVREKQTGKLTTIYWSEKTKAPEIIEGDFSKIPAEDPGEKAPDSPPAPAPAQN